MFSDMLHFPKNEDRSPGLEGLRGSDFLAFKVFLKLGCLA